MSYAALRWARGVRGITPAQKAVLLLLADQANDDHECWPSVNGLADDACLSERGARDCLRALEAAGLMTREPGGGRHRTTLYRLAVTACETRQMRADTRHQLPRFEASETRQMVPERGQMLPERGQTVPERGQHLPPNHQEPSRTTKEPSPRARKPDPMTGFAEFWRMYPRKVGKGQAERAWPKAVAAAGGNHEDILAGLKVALALDAFDLRDDARFCPHASTWLNGKRWLDGIEPEPDPQPSLIPAH